MPSTLRSALGLARDLQTPFQTQLSGTDRASVPTQLQNAGFSILMPFTGSPPSRDGQKKMRGLSETTTIPH
jgi:hypothetical protein